MERRGFGFLTCFIPNLSISREGQTATGQITGSAIPFHGCGRKGDGLHEILEMFQTTSTPAAKSRKTAAGNEQCQSNGVATKARQLWGEIP